jgi:hypothetical protein
MHFRKLVVLTCLGMACTISHGRLPPLTEKYRHLDATIAVDLPDSGGYLFNGVPIPRDRIREQLTAVFLPRRDSLRAFLVWDTPSRRADAHWLASLADSLGGAAFDAELSGWPRPESMRRDSAQ